MGKLNIMLGEYKIRNLKDDLIISNHFKIEVYLIYFDPAIRLNLIGIFIFEWLYNSNTTS